MKFKHILIVFVLGTGFSELGAAMTILNWPFVIASLAISAILKASAVIGLIVKLISFKDSDSILNK